MASLSSRAWKTEPAAQSAALTGSHPFARALHSGSGRGVSSRPRAVCSRSPTMPPQLHASGSKAKGNFGAAPEMHGAVRLRLIRVCRWSSHETNSRSRAAAICRKFRGNSPRGMNAAVGALSEGLTVSCDFHYSSVTEYSEA